MLVTRHPSLRFAPAVVLAVGLRWRFVSTPITSDEGGFLAIARAWARGADLYETVWVDRPQGLLVLFRLLHVLGLGTPEGVRVLGIVACAAGAVACGLVAEELFVRRASTGVIASCAVAVMTSVATYEGFVTNGELLSGATGAIALAIALRSAWHRTPPSHAGLLAAGVVGGVALSIKQSGFDAFACAVVAVAWRAAQPRWPRADRVRAVPMLAAGTAIPIALMVLHGAATGWDRFWYAVAGYRLEARSAVVGANWERLGVTWDIAAPTLVGCFAVIAAGLLLSALRPELRAAAVLAVVWLALAAVAFVSGGQFHRHYWVIAAFPVGTLAGGIVASVPSRWARVALVLLVLARPIDAVIDAARLPRSEVPRVTSGDTRLRRDEQVAAWFEERAGEDDEIYALCASASIYGNVDIDPPFPYLWLDNVLNIPGATDELARMLRSDDGPRFVAVHQRPSVCDPSGATGAALREHYDPVAKVNGVAIHERTSTAGEPYARGGGTDVDGTAAGAGSRRHHT